MSPLQQSAQLSARSWFLSQLNGTGLYDPCFPRSQPAFCLWKNVNQSISLIRELRRCRNKGKQSNKINNSLVIKPSQGPSFLFKGYSGEGNGTPLQCSCLENPRDSEAWWAAIYGVAQSRTRLKRLSSSSSSNISLYIQTHRHIYTSSLSIHLLMDIQVASMSWRL